MFRWHNQSVMLHTQKKKAGNCTSIILKAQPSQKLVRIWDATLTLGDRAWFSHPSNDVSAQRSTVLLATSPFFARISSWTAVECVFLVAYVVETHAS